MAPPQRSAPPVVPVQATASSTEFSQAGQQLARLLQLVESFQNYTPQTARRGEWPAAMAGPARSNFSNLDASALAKSLRSFVQQSGLFYESNLAQWIKQKMPFESLLRQPQNQSQQPQRVLGLQLDMIHSGILKFELDIAPQVHFVGIFQPDIHPLIRSYYQQDKENNDTQEGEGWTSEIKLTLPMLGEFRAHIRLQGQLLYLQLQCQDRYVERLRSELSELRKRFTMHANVKLERLIVRGMK